MVGRRASIGAVAAGGILTAHQLAYRIDHLTRGSHSHQDEHGYLTSLVAIVLPISLAGLGWLIGSREGRAAPLPRRATLALVLIGAFLLQELTERMLGGVPLRQAVGEPVLWWGVLIQGLVALALVPATRVGRAVALALTGRTPRPGRRASAEAHPPHRSAMLPPLTLLGSLSRRGPPQLLAPA